MNLSKRITVSILIVSIYMFGISSQLLANDESNILDLGTVSDGVRHVSATEAAQLIEQNADIKVLDVRTGWEYKRGHVEGAENLNYYAFSFKKSIGKLDKKTTWLVHCKSGVRSGNTIPIMQEAGFESIIHMDGGFDAWKKAALPVKK